MATAVVGLSLALDALFEEFPARIHPVAAFGRLVAPFDGVRTAPAALGCLVALVLPVGAAAIGGGVTALALGVDPRLGVVVAALVLFSATSLRMLLAATRRVVAASEADPSAAREAAVALVGRDTTALSPGELRSAALESASENLADGLVAPLAAFALGAQISLPIAVGAAAWVKAVNTLDSMLGYRSKPIGRASARLDDAVMWVPARLAAALIALAGASPMALARARAWRTAPTSPNSGWPMAALAAVLDVQLTKRSHYVLNADAALPTATDARRGVRVVAIAGVLTFLLSGVIAWL